jgi:hypothetical protein
VAGAGSEAQYQDILQSLAFESRTAHPKETLRKVSITVYDERGLAGGSAEISTTIGVEDGRGSKGRSDALVASKETDGFLGLDDASLDLARADASPGANAAEDAGVFDSVIQNGSAGGGLENAAAAASNVGAEVPQGLDDVAPLVALDQHHGHAFV